MPPPLGAHGHWIRDTGALVDGGSAPASANTGPTARIPQGRQRRSDEQNQVAHVVSLRPCSSAGRGRPVTFPGGRQVSDVLPPKIGDVAPGIEGRATGRGRVFRGFSGGFALSHTARFLTGGRP